MQCYTLGLLVPPNAHIMQPQPRLGDILANAITHGVGAAFALIGATYLIYISSRGSARQIVSCSIYAGTLVLVYVCSTLYHSLVRTGARRVFHILDHSSIYLLIAGNLYAVHAGLAARHTGLDVVRHRMVTRDCRSRFQKPRDRAI